MDSSAETFERLSAPIRIALRFASEGCGNAEIARRMGLTPTSVRLMLAEAALAFGVSTRKALLASLAVEDVTDEGSRRLA